ncbi:MAG: DNA repair exonuclease [Oscillospiraceae bacterium]|nr:DNA repair exonuclease [Oscillospiraceae bacterium]
MKVIHCADLHLDSPLTTHMSREQAARRSLELLHSFVRLTRYAREEGVRVVLIAGDLFDGERVKLRTLETLLEAVAQSPEVDYLYLPGNHDGAARAFSGRQLPPNLHCFSETWTSFSYPEAVIFGIQMTRDNAESLYQSLPRRGDRPHIVTLHGQAGSASGLDRVNLNLLRDRGVDYLALGHIHSQAWERLDGTGYYGYPGCLEGRGFDECGDKGFFLLEIQGQRIAHRFVPFACRRLHRVPVDLTGVESGAALLSRMEQAAAHIGPEDMVEFVLTGDSDPAANISLSYLEQAAALGHFFVRVKDESRLALRPEDYANDVSLKGAFIRLVLAGEGSEADKAAIIRAGLAALAGEEVLL